MNIDKLVDELKLSPGFAEKVGMVLIHNGTVREFSRLTAEKVAYLDVNPDFKRMDTLCREFEGREGIFKVVAEARAGRLKPGDDLLLLVVAGDIREHVLPVMSELLDRIKAEAVRKQEIG
jgi:molybdopterin synthase catalytic subunit